MAKNKKGASAAEAAAAQQHAPEDKKPQTKVNVIDVRDLDPSNVKNGFGSLDANHTVDLLKMSHETFRMDPNAAQHNGVSQEVVDTMNHVNAIGQVAMVAIQAYMDNTPFAASIRNTLLPELTKAAAELGITIDQKLLPAPNKDGMVSISKDAVKASKEAKEAIKEEIAASKKTVKNDPTKIENEDELRDALLSILSINSPGGFYNKISDATAFHKSYRELIASKGEDKDAIAAIKSETFADSLLKLTEFVGKCPFSLGGLANFMFDKTMESKNPVAAFCSFRDASLNKTTGMPSIDDHIVADIVKVFVKWCADSRIAKAKESIQACRDNIKALGKDKKNEKAVKANETEIKKINELINEYNCTVGYAMMPSTTCAKEFIAAYNDNKSQGFKNARMTASKILATYYPGIKLTEVEHDNLMVILEQYFGVIINMFLPPVDQSAEYSESNIPELKKVEKKIEEKPAEEKPAEEDPKKEETKEEDPKKA